MIKFGERYYDEWLGEVNTILLDDECECIGAVNCIEEDDEVYIAVLSFIHGYKEFRYFEEAVNIIKSMYPGKKLTGVAGPTGCYCGDPEDWEAVGAVTKPDPDDEIFTIFELENKED